MVHFYYFLMVGSYQHMQKITSKLVNGILAAAKANGHAACGGNINGMYGFFFCEGPVKSFTDAAKSDTKKFARFAMIFK